MVKVLYQLCTTVYQSDHKKIRETKQKINQLQPVYVYGLVTEHNNYSVIHNVLNKGRSLQLVRYLHLRPWSRFGEAVKAKFPRSGQWSRHARAS